MKAEDSYKEKLKKILSGEITKKDLLPEGIVVLNDSDHKNINPDTGRPYSRLVLDNATTILTLPINGREAQPSNSLNIDSIRTRDT